MYPMVQGCGVRFRVWPIIHDVWHMVQVCVVCGGGGVVYVQGYIICSRSVSSCDSGGVTNNAWGVIYDPWGVVYGPGLFGL